jgi:predicted glycosyltransferase involved in capsule biosynthesis
MNKSNVIREGGGASDGFLGATFIDRWDGRSDLTVIISFRASIDRADGIDRLRRNPGNDSETPSRVHFLVVDDGSPASLVAEIDEILRQRGWSYLRLPTEDRHFSVGRCRNAGAMYARSDFILFQDVDLIPPAGFYNRLLAETRVQGLRATATSFLMVPCIYLTEAGVGELRRTPPEDQAQLFHHYALTGDTSRIERVSTGTSVTLHHRRYFLSRGGNNEGFVGWGYEDIEFINRCIRNDGRFPRPREWATERGDFDTVEYSTWKASYRLYGDTLFAKGIAIFHAWHPVTRDGAYFQKSAANRKIFLEKLSGGLEAEPDPLPDLSRGRTLCFRKNTFTAHRDVMPYLGTLHFESETEFQTKARFMDYLGAHGIRRVLFHNPYSSEAMADIYRWCRELGLPYLVAERGALNRSFFFDPEGFLADSASYAGERWDRPLDAAERAQVVDYMAEERLANQALEDQPDRIGPSALRRKLGIAESDFMIFVALQRPGDTATRFMTRGNRTYARFIELLTELDAAIPPGVKVVVKKHPLEDDVPAFGNCISVDDCHVADLLGACNSILTFNSGVGVLAMLWGKFCLLYGKAFYQIDGVNRYVDGARDVLDHVRSPAKPDETLIERFVHYLRYEFYSIGDFRTRAVRMPTNERMTATLDIAIRELQVPGFPRLRHRQRDSLPLVGWRAPLFDRYRHAEGARLGDRAPGAAEKPPAGVECTRSAAPALADAFAGCPGPQHRALTPYQEFVRGARMAYKADTGDGRFEMDRIEPVALPFGPESALHGLRFRTVREVDIEWALLEFEICPDVFRVGETYEIVGFMSSRVQIEVRSGLYVNRASGADPWCHAVVHTIDWRLRPIRNRFNVTQDTFADRAPGTASKYFLQLQGGTAVDVSLWSFAVYHVTSSDTAAAGVDSEGTEQAASAA